MLIVMRITQRIFFVLWFILIFQSNSYAQDYKPQCDDYIKSGFNEAILSNYPISYYTNGMALQDIWYATTQINYDKTCIDLQRLKNHLNKVSNANKKNQITKEIESLSKALSYLENEKRVQEQLKVAITAFYDELRAKTHLLVFMWTKELIDKNAVMADNFQENTKVFMSLKESNNKYLEDLTSSLKSLKWTSDKQTRDNIERQKEVDTKFFQDKISKFKPLINDIIAESKKEITYEIDRITRESISNFEISIQKEKLSSDKFEAKVKAYEQLLNEQREGFFSKIDTMLYGATAEANLYITIIENLIWSNQTAYNSSSFNPVLVSAQFVATLKADIPVINQENLDLVGTPRAFTRAITVRLDNIVLNKIPEINIDLQKAILSLEFNRLLVLRTPADSMRLIAEAENWNVAQLVEIINASDGKLNVLIKDVISNINKIKIKDANTLKVQIQWFLEAKDAQPLVWEARRELLAIFNSTKQMIKASNSLSMFVNAKLTQEEIRIIQKISANFWWKFVGYMIDAFEKRNFISWRDTLLIQDGVNWKKLVDDEISRYANYKTRYVDYMYLLLIDWIIRWDNNVIQVSSKWEYNLWSDFKTIIANYWQLNSSKPSEPDKTISIWKQVDPTAMTMYTRKTHWDKIYLYNSKSNYVVVTDKNSLALKTLLFDNEWRLIQRADASWLITFFDYDSLWRLIARTTSLARESWSNSAWTFVKPAFDQQVINDRGKNIYVITEQVEWQYLGSTSNISVRKEFSPELSLWERIPVRILKYSYLYEDLYIRYFSYLNEDFSSSYYKALGNLQANGIYYKSLTKTRPYREWEERMPLLGVFYYNTEDYTPILNALVSRLELFDWFKWKKMWQIEIFYDENFDLYGIKWLKFNYATNSYDDDYVQISIRSQNKARHDFEGSVTKRDIEVDWTTLWLFKIDPVYFIDKDGKVLQDIWPVEKLLYDWIAATNSFFQTNSKFVTNVCEVIDDAKIFKHADAICKALDISWTHASMIGSWFTQLFFATSLNLVQTAWDIQDLFVYHDLAERKYAFKRDFIRDYRWLIELISGK